MLKQFQKRNPYRFWKWFLKHEKDFHTVNDDTISKINLKMYHYLAKFNPFLGFEFSKESGDERTELIITANHNPYLFDTVFSLINAAPNHIKDRWIFTPLRQPDKKGDLIIYVENLMIKSDDIFYELEESEDIPGKFDILIYINGVVYDSEEIEDFVMITASSFLDHIIGEYQSTLKLNELILVEKDELINPKKISELKNEFH